MTIVQVEGLGFDYPGHRALDGVTFSLRAGSITALVGPNGAGKTTLLRCLAALEPVHAGRVLFEGLDVAESPRAAHRRIGYLPDDFGLYAELSAARCLEYAGLSRGLRGDALATRVRACAAQVGLDDRLSMRAGHLSRGQRQRLALAQAIVHAPSLLLLDEPASGLDPEARGELSSLMRALAAGGMTLVVSSHILAELESYCTDMLVLQGGRMVEQRAAPAAADQHAGAVAVQHRRVRIRLAPNASLLPLPHLPLSHLPASLRQPEIVGDTIVASVEGDDAALAATLAALLAAGLPVCEFTPVATSLQDSYLAALREARQ